ncbi:MAG: hypothetical protein GY816_10505 [Cytophagales bacterium]|nr:hypothetical protein [Cytophagales bacterium]
MGENKLSQMVRIPFDFLNQHELSEPFTSIGFLNVQMSKQEQDLTISGGIEGAIELTYATPIGPRLQEFSNVQTSQFHRIFAKIINELSPDNRNMGRMVSNVLVAEKMT